MLCGNGNSTDSLAYLSGDCFLALDEKLVLENMNRQFQQFRQKKFLRELECVTETQNMLVTNQHRFGQIQGKTCNLNNQDLNSF